MFSGIIQSQGVIAKLRKLRGNLRIGMKFVPALNRVRMGESIAVDGVCLTVAARERSLYCFDLVPETLAATTLGSVRQGDRVNVERSLRIGDVLGGHFVSGHVDGKGRIKVIERRKDGLLLTVQAPKKIMRYVARKGSIAIDGISLTVQAVRNTSFDVAIIPHTLKVTTLGAKGEGDRVNLEADMLARYAERSELAAEAVSSYPVTVDALRNQGF